LDELTQAAASRSCRTSMSRGSTAASLAGVRSGGMTQSRSRVFVRTIRCVAADVLRFASSMLRMLRSHAQLAAENLFLRKQLALYLERQVKPRRADDATRLTLIALSRLIDWRQLLTLVKPETLSFAKTRRRLPAKRSGPSSDLHTQIALN
jgi:hypothetical protein